MESFIDGLRDKMISNEKFYYRNETKTVTEHYEQTV